MFLRSQIVSWLAQGFLKSFYFVVGRWDENSLLLLLNIKQILHCLYNCFHDPLASIAGKPGTFLCISITKLEHWHKSHFMANQKLHLKKQNSNFSDVLLSHWVSLPVIGTKLQVKWMDSRSIFDLLVLSEMGLGFSLWMTVFRQYRTFTLWRQKAASTLPCSQGARLSPLISLEEHWKCVMEEWVAGEAVRESFMWADICVLLYVSVKQCEMCAGFCCVGSPECKHALVGPSLCWRPSQHILPRLFQSCAS